MSNSLVKILIALIAVAVVGAVGVNAMSFGRDSTQGHSRCEVGKTSKVPRQHTLLAGGGSLPGPIVIGCGRSNGEAVQIVAYNVRGAFCFGVYRPKRGSFEGGECKPNDARWSDYCTDVCIYSDLPIDLGSGSRLL